MPESLESFLSTAQLAAMEAGNLALRQFMRIHVLREKKMSTDEVTSVDIACEKKIVKILKQSFPQHTIFTEERQLPRNRGKFSWWVDPLDGSVSYFFGLPYWGVSLALISGGEPIVGVIYFPLTRDLFWAVKGGGAYRNYEKIVVSTAGSLAQGVVGVDYGYKGERDEGLREVTARIIDQVKYVVTYACTVGALALVAEGKLVGYIHHMARRFDLAAGALLISEAGGKISDTQGRPINWQETVPVHCLATNGRVQHQLLALLRRIPRQSG